MRTSIVLNDAISNILLKGRKRKKKCDEKKPSCTSCVSKCISCVWPKDGGDRLPKEYSVPKADKEGLKTRKGSTFIPVRFDTNNIDTPLEEFTETPLDDDCLDLLKTPEETGLIPYTNPNVSELIENCESPENSSEFSLDLENTSSTHYSITFLSPFTHDPDQRFMLACINGFIQSVGPQYTHPLLTTSATFSPFVNHNTITQKVAAACGCAFLSWQSPELTSLSAQKYYIAFNALNSYVKNNEMAYKDNWVGAAFQLMCLCSKITWSCSSANGVTNLTNSYKIIKKKFLSGSNQRQKLISNSRLESQSDLNHYLEEFKNDTLKMEIENSLIHLDSYSSNYFDSHFEKMFVESFIFNYSITLLVSDEYYLLPNPFEVFRELRHLLKTPLFSCDVAWMNNPVFGASLDAFELAAKASYLLRNLNDPLMLVTAKKLYDIACFYPSPMIPSEIRVESKKYKNLRDSVLMAEIVAKSSKILLRKLIIPEITEMDTVVQNALSEIMPKIKSISRDSRVKIISCWPLLIAGAASLIEEQRELLTECLLEAGVLTHGRHIYTVVNALNIAWGKSPDCDEIHTRGLDILFDRRVMKEVIL